MLFHAESQKSAAISAATKLLAPGYWGKTANSLLILSGYSCGHDQWSQQVGDPLTLKRRYDNVYCNRLLMSYVDGVVEVVCDFSRMSLARNFSGDQNYDATQHPECTSEAPWKDLRPLLAAMHASEIVAYSSALPQDALPYETMQAYVDRVLPCGSLAAWADIAAKLPRANMDALRDIAAYAKTRLGIAKGLTEQQIRARLTAQGYSTRFAELLAA